jgi:hypothetical protein
VNNELVVNAGTYDKLKSGKLRRGNFQIFLKYLRTPIPSGEWKAKVEITLKQKSEVDVAAATMNLELLTETSNSLTIRFTAGINLSSVITD